MTNQLILIISTNVIAASVLGWCITFIRTVQQIFQVLLISERFIIISSCSKVVRLLISVQCINVNVCAKDYNQLTHKNQF